MAMLYVFLISNNYLYIKQLLPGFLVNSAGLSPRGGIISRGLRPREIIPSRGDNLHYPPIS